MAWTNSKVFSSFLTDMLNNTTAITLSSDTIDAALYDNTITPDQTVTSANSAYNAGVWASGHVLDASGWPSVGRPLASKTSTFTTNVYTFAAANTVSANGNTTLGSTYGCLVYDATIASPVANQGICFNYFGGANSVTNGTFTVVWNGSGIYGATL